MTEHDTGGPAIDGAAIEDTVLVDIKGPDPAEWGEEHAAADPSAPVSAALGGLGIGEIVNEGTEEELKGPGPQWREYHNNSEGA